MSKENTTPPEEQPKTPAASEQPALPLNGVAPANWADGLGKKSKVDPLELSIVQEATQTLAARQIAQQQATQARTPDQIAAALAQEQVAAALSQEPAPAAPTSEAAPYVEQSDAQSVPEPQWAEEPAPAVIGPLSAAEYLGAEDEAEATAQTTPEAASASAQNGAPEEELPDRIAALKAQRGNEGTTGALGKKRHPVLKAVLITLLCLIVVLGAGAGYLYYHDQQMADTIPNGVTFYHEPLGGATKGAVSQKVETVLNSLGSKQLTLQVADQSQTVPLKDFVSFDTTRIVDEVTSVRASIPVLQRLQHDWLHKKIVRDISLPYVIDSQAVNSYVADLAKAHEKDPSDAQISLPDGSLEPTITPEVLGMSVDTTPTSAALTQAIKTCISKDATQTVTVAVSTTQPQVTAASLADTRVIVVCLSQKRMWLYQGSTMLRNMLTATGKPGFETRPGNYFIGQKRPNPTWINPHEDWSKDMPDSIGPGPGNPLGARAMNVVTYNDAGQVVDYGYRIHGGTVGAGASSHGCLHLSNSDVIYLYDQVVVGTPVFIRP